MLSGTTTLLSEQKITSPLGTPERNTTATSRQGLTWWTLDHKPLLSEKENNCHTHKKNLTQSKAEKSDYLWIAFSLCGLLFPPQCFYIGAIHLPTGKRSSWEKKAFLKYLLLFNNIQSEIHSQVCFSYIRLKITAFLKLTCPVHIKQYLNSEMLTQFYCCERHMHALQIKNTLEIKKQHVTQCQQYV